MAERRRRPNARTRQRRSFQPTLPAEVRSAAPDDGPMDEQRLLERWRRRAVHARRLRRDWEEEYAVETLERFFLGKHTQLGTDTDRSAIWLNHFFATVQTQRPALLPTKLSFLVEPAPGQPQRDRLLARIQAGVLETIAAQDGHLMKILRLAMTQTFFRLGVLKVSYDPRMEDNPRAGEPLLNEEDQAMVGTLGERLREPDQVLTDEIYRWQWVNARNMLLPDEGPDTTRWTWIGEEIEVSVEEARDDTSFPADKRQRIQANGRLRDWEQTSTLDTDDPERDIQRFRYTECWDIREHRRYVWAEGQPFDGFLVNEPVQDGIEDHPYALLLPVPVIAPKPSPWPMPLTYNWLPIQQQYNVLRLQQIEAGKRAARKVLYDETTFPDADEAQKFLESSKDMQAVKITDLGRLPQVVGDGAQSIDVTRNIPFLLADWQRVTGATGTRLGDPNADTATEAVLTEQSAAVRDSEVRTLVTEWLTDAGRKMLQLVKQTLTLDLWIQLKDFGDKDIQEFLQSPGFQAYLGFRVGPQNVAPLLQMMTILPGMWEMLRERFGALTPLRVTRTQLQMEADVKVLPSTIRPIYRAQLLQLTSILGPAALLSPTLLEELLHSFELPQGDRIAEELLANLQQQGGVGALPGGRQRGMQPQPGSAGSPLQTQNPLAAAVGLREM